VIAELSRKLEDTNDVIREESEFEETSVVTDSCLEEEDDHDEPVITSSKIFNFYTSSKFYALFTNDECTKFSKKAVPLIQYLEGSAMSHLHHLDWYVECLLKTKLDFFTEKSGTKSKL
jgi:hypothetical protein